MLTSEEIINMFMAIEAKPRAAPPKRKPAQVKFDERCAEKPTEAMIRDAAVHNEAVAERLRKERELAVAEARRANYQAQLDRHWQSMLDAQREQREFRMVGGFLEGPNPGDYSPVARFEREWRR
jgi:hypothetical protein